MKKLFILVLLLIAVLIVSMCRAKVEEMEGPKYAPVFQQLSASESSIQIDVYDVDVLERINLQVQIEEGVFSQIEKFRYGSTMLDPQTIYLK